MIEVAHLTRRFGPLVAVDDASFSIGRGEVVGFLGPNGAGKTTTLRILAGYLPATSGAASVAGFDVLRESIEVRRRIGYLPESVPLYRELRVSEMLRFQARLHGLSRAQGLRRAGAVLEQVGLLGRERSLIGTLSRGLKQRAGLAVALLPEPQVLILDEPTSGLDPLQRLEVRALVQGLAQRHTVILSSHILPEVEAVCPRVIVIHKGRIAADGTQEQLLRSLGGAAHVRLELRLGPGGPAAALLAALPGARGVRELSAGATGGAAGAGAAGAGEAAGAAGAADGVLAVPGSGAARDADGAGGAAAAGGGAPGMRCFEIACDDDLREAAGALCRAQGWQVRELSWRRPDLEQIFARIALGHGDEVAEVRA